jgi:hypothetical protein
MRIAYVSGPYRADTTEGIEANIQRAREVAKSLWRMGYAVICPHSNTAHFSDDDCPPWRTKGGNWNYIQGDLEMISRFDPNRDILVMIQDWRKSAGAIEERDFAISRGIAVYEWPDVPEVERE